MKDNIELFSFSRKHNLTEEDVLTVTFVESLTEPELRLLLDGYRSLTHALFGFVGHSSALSRACNNQQLILAELAERQHRRNRVPSV